MAITSAAATSIASLYIGFYDRAPDPVGLNYWIGRLDAGVSLTDIAESFAASPEAAATYPYIAQPNLFTPDLMINQVYQNIFGRDADDDGMAYYTARLESGESVGSVLASIIGNAATNDDGAFPDQGILANKVEVGLNWAEQAGLTGAAIYEADGATLTDAAADSAAGVIDGVDETDASVTAANAETAGFFGGDAPGDIFTLTAGIGPLANPITGGVDIVTGTDGADTIRAINPLSLDSTDIIDGGAGNDVLNISVGGILPGAAPVISNVETINNAGGNLNLSSVTGANQINSTANAVYDAVSIATTFGISDSAATVGFNTIADDLTGTNDTLNLAVDGATAGAFFSSGAYTNDIEHINLSVASDSAVAVAFAPETLTITGEGDLLLGGLTNTNLESVDASGLDGDFTWTDGALANDLEVTGSQGIDTLTLTGAADQDITVNSGAGADVITVSTTGDVVIEGGAGNDTIDVTAAEATITGGAGGDSIDVTNADANIVYAAQGDSTYVNFDSIDGFTAGSDTIDLSAFTFTGKTDTVADGTTTVHDIGSLAGGVADFFHVGADVLAVATFQDAVTGDTYVLADVNNDGNFDAAHDLVVNLVGGVAVTDADFVFA